MKKRNNNDPFIKLVLDEEEKQLEESLEKGEFESDPELEKTKNMLQEAASRYLQLHNSKPVTLRINQLDLIKIKAKAKRKQIPYQTLLGVLLHDFAEGERELSLK
ncbi:MAG TPA: antitoxin [Patescibacteria group bacterium]|nr:antitoxin [Patescibacteria group bacterium]